MTSPAPIATAVAERAADLGWVDWDEVGGADAVAAVEAIAAARTYLDAALLRGAARLEETDALREAGWASLKDYLTHLTGGRKGTGGGLVRAMEQFRDLPAVQSALDKAQVTLPQARAIATRIQSLPRAGEFRTTVAEAMLALVDEHDLDASDLDTAFDQVVRDLDPDNEYVDLEKERAQTERGVHHARHLSFAPDQYGGVKVTGYGTVEDAERITSVLQPLAAPIATRPGACGGRLPAPEEPTFDDNGDATTVPCLTPGCHHDGRDPRDAGARMWDALVDACDRLRATDVLPTDHGATPKVVVLIDHDSLTQKVIDSGRARPAQTPTGHTLSAAATRRLACDAEIIPAVLGTHSHVLDVGRTHRLITPGLWTALIIRDRHCAFPGCTRMPLACDAHHIRHWADGGHTKLDNLVMLCRRHHTLIHHTPWVVQIDPATHHPRWTTPRPQTLTDLRDRGLYLSPAPPRDPPRAA